MRAFASALWAGAGALGVSAFAAVSCGGQPFVAATDAAATSAEASVIPPDVGTTDREAEASVTWCASMDASAHTFCEDFSEGVPGKLSTQTGGGGTLDADTVNFVLAPPSMRATTPNLPNPGQMAEAFGLYQFTGIDGLHDVLQTEIRVDSSCFAHGNKDAVTVAVLSFMSARYALAVLAASNATTLVEALYGADGGISNLALHPFGAPLPIDKWSSLVVDARLSVALADTVSVTVNSVDVLKNEKLTLIPATPANHPSLLLGASVTNSMSVSTGCAVNIAHVLFDIGP
jgi:hypothetical protein